MTITTADPLAISIITGYDGRDDTAATLLPEFIKERDHGLTYREIGERHGLSHERVRQILTEGGIAPRERNWAAEYRKQHLADAVTAWLVDNGPTTSDRVREQFGLTIQQLSELMGHGIPKHLVLAGQGRTGSAYDDEALADAVKQAWARYRAEHPEAEKFSVNAYEDIRDPGDPSLALITSRVPWKQVCAWADVPCSKGRGDYKRAWDDDDLLDWVGKYLHAAERAGERVTFYGYDKWRKDKTGAPSGALVRTRLRRGGYATWGSMVAAAVHPDLRLDPVEATPSPAEATVLQSVETVEPESIDVVEPVPGDGESVSPGDAEEFVDEPLPEIMIAPLIWEARRLFSDGSQ